MHFAVAKQEEKQSYSFIIYAFPPPSIEYILKEIDFYISRSPNQGFLAVVNSE